MQVDIHALQSFAQSTSRVASDIGNHDVSSPFADSDGSLPGTGFDGVNRRALDAAMAGYRNVALRLGEVARLAGGANTHYVVAETDFVKQLGAMDVEP
ncbi:hypothetical protein [Rhodococcus sp. HNM0569]|uniref:hypothetical protein n=1 Tax=Rhodococcus sp. HNM0569 TaxID=2716340 RepID=UPI00146DB4BA|nr:hypothetical protein [Rhodococcus sp. HNM0569]NLU82723.1 hypothetical protein [Rhodococcus sp. HNM0569]